MIIASIIDANYPDQNACSSDINVCCKASNTWCNGRDVNRDGAVDSTDIINTIQIILNA